MYDSDSKAHDCFAYIKGSRKGCAALTDYYNPEHNNCFKCPFFRSKKEMNMYAHTVEMAAETLTMSISCGDAQRIVLNAMRKMRDGAVKQFICLKYFKKYPDVNIAKDLGLAFDYVKTVMPKIAAYTLAAYLHTDV